jgi:hypothetical protein
MGSSGAAKHLQLSSSQAVGGPKQSQSLPDAEDYKGFEAAITADYDAQSAVERELVLRLASLLWRLRRATTIETGLFEIQADHLSSFRRTHLISPASRAIVYALFNADSDRQAASHGVANTTKMSPASRLDSTQGQVAPDVELARCFLRLCNLPNYALDRLSRYEATLWRQAGQILFALDNLDRRKPQGMRHSSWR